LLKELLTLEVDLDGVAIIVKPLVPLILLLFDLSRQILYSSWSNPINASEVMCCLGSESFRSCALPLYGSTKLTQERGREVKMIDLNLVSVM